MFAFIKGTLAHSSPIAVVINVGGVGYKIFISANLYSNLPPQGTELLLHTSFVVRELSQTLYGFLTTHERDCFEALMGVTGVGPKIALSIIGHLTPQELHKAIVNANIAAICKVPGIGKKNSERLIIEMRDKMSAFLPDPTSQYAISASTDPQTQKINDAMSALINLGYNQMTAQKAIKQTIKETSEEIDLGTLITSSLKNV